MKNLFDIRGRVVVVTGGAGILGRSICAYLAGQGARVAVLDDVARIQRDEFATLYRGESVPFDAERHERAIENDLLERTSDEDEALIKLSSKGCLRYRQAFEQIAAARP